MESVGDIYQRFCEGIKTCAITKELGGAVNLTMILKFTTHFQKNYNFVKSYKKLKNFLKHSGNFVLGVIW